METRNDDKGSKPYRTYKASGRQRRNQLDDELAGARPARPQPAGRDESAQQRPTGRTAPGQPRPARGDAAQERPARRCRLSHVRLFVRPQEVVPEAHKGRAPLPPAGAAFAGGTSPSSSSLCSSSPASWPRCWRGPATRSSTAPSTRPTSASTRARAAQLTPDQAWIWRGGTTMVLFGLDAAGLPAHSDTIMLMHFDAKHHKINQLSIPRDTLVNVPGYGQAKITEAMWYGGPTAGAQDAEGVHRASPSTTSWSSASRGSRASSTPSAASTCTCRRR